MLGSLPGLIWQLEFSIGMTCGLPSGEISCVEEDPISEVGVRKFSEVGVMDTGSVITGVGSKGRVGIGAGVYVGPGTVGAIVTVGSFIGISVGSVFGILQAYNNDARLKKAIRKINDPDFFINYLSKKDFVLRISKVSKSPLGKVLQEIMLHIQR